ncbi:MAG: hypothetical protein JO097_06455, partial [Acidobacteriaceae bacterium]|nr:hypothetical protein [Acidobacteriaceae bacterium]
MPVRIKVPSKSKTARSVPAGRPGRFSKPLFYGAIAAVVLATVVVCFYYAKYARLTDEKLAQGPFPNSSLLYAAPQMVGVGDPGTPLQFAAKLRESGYGEDVRTNATGWYHLRPEAIEIFPGGRSYSNAEPGVLRFQDGKISSIIALSDNTARMQYTLEPQLLSSLYDK